MERPRTPIIWQSKKRWHIPIAHTTNSPLAKIAFRCKFTECVSRPEIAVGGVWERRPAKGLLRFHKRVRRGCTSESSGSSCSCCCFFEWVTFGAALPPFTTAERAAAERESGSALSLKREIFPSEPAAIAVRMTAHRQQAISSRANLEPDHQLRSPHRRSQAISGKFPKDSRTQHLQYFRRRRGPRIFLSPAKSRIQHTCPLLKQWH